MYKKLFFPKNLFLLVIAAFIFACSNDDDIGTVNPPVDIEVEDSHLFVWNALNSWYYYQEDIPDLSDSKNDNQTEFYNYLNDFSSPEDLFYNLVNDPFSYMTDNYDDLGGGLSARYDGFGFDYALATYNGSNNPVLGYVRFVFPGSPAEDAGLERGKFFIEVNGEQLTETNFSDLLFDQETAFDLTMAEIVDDGNGGQVIQETGEVITVEISDFQQTPVWVEKTIQLDAGNKVGYLVYSHFAYNFHEELNNAFQNFASEGITDLVLDLRYNPGGSVLTAIYLNSLIYSNDPNLLMGSLQYNQKHVNDSGNLYFQDEMEIKDNDFETTNTIPLQSLNLDRLFVITSGSTASASEFVINALRSYIDVNIVGDVTVGKNVGSISLYDDPDSDYTDKENANSSHTYGLQPIVSKVFNADNQSDYDNGFVPDISISEFEFIQDLRPLGNTDEQLLAVVLNEICATCRTAPVTFEKVDIGQQFISERDAQFRGYRVLDVTGLQ